MAMTWQELRTTPTDELIRRHDEMVKNVVPSLNEVRQELVHRDQLYAAQAQYEQAAKVGDLTEATAGLTSEYTDLTRQITKMTRRMLRFTIAASVVAVAAVVLSIIGIATDNSGDILREEQRQSCLADLSVRAAVALAAASSGHDDQATEALHLKVDNRPTDDIDNC